MYLIIPALLLAFLVQATPQGGPRNLQLDEDHPVKPPVVVPKGTTIPIALINRINTKNAKDGDGIYARTIFPITIDNKIVIPEGSNLRGKISEVRQPGRVKGKASLTISFQTLILPSGATMPIYASLGGASGAGKREGETGIEGDSSKTQDAQTRSPTTVEGAAVGGLAGRGKGAGIGAGAGVAVGLATVLLTRGQDLILEPGTTIEIVLDRALEQ